MSKTDAEAGMGWTPGPWEWIGDDRQQLTGRGGITTIIRDVRWWNARGADARLIAAAPELADALRGLEPFFARDGEGSTERFERLALLFYRDTGLLAPGKDAGAGSGQPEYEERRRKYAEWYQARVQAARAALARLEEKQ